MDVAGTAFGRYTLTQRLATGGMAEVFKAKISAAHGFEKALVIKRILPNLAADRNFVSMFIDEAKLTAQLIHPKIVQVIDFGEVKGQYFIALEFIDGFDALALLRGSATKQLRLPPPIGMFIAMEVLDALDYAHQARDAEGRPMRLVHRDISPSNVFIARRGDVKLGDFGIAHAQERESKTQAGTLKGKYGYMSPEQVLGNALDGRSDVFAVGIVLAEMLMGRRLFSAVNDLDVLLMVRDGRLDRLDKYARDLPPALDAIVRKALAKNLPDRYQSAAEFRDALADLLFQTGMRVSPSDIGRVAADFLDPSPEATARLREQLPRWEMRERRPPGPPGHHTPAPLVDEPGSLPGAASSGGGSSAPSFRRRDGKGTPAPSARRTGSGADEPIQIDEDEAGNRAAEAGHAAATLDQLLSQPLSVVDLDKYEVPSRAGSAPGVPLPTPARAPGLAPTAAGDLGAMTAMRIFCDLAVAGETGLLRLETPPHTRDVFLSRGTPESVASDLPSARFSEYLVSRGVLHAETMQMALGHLPRFGGKLSEALAGLGLLKPVDVFALLAEQVRGRVIELFALTTGRASFYRGVRNSEESFPLGLDSFEILGAGVLTLPLDLLRQRYMPLLEQRPQAINPPRLDPTTFRLGPTPRELWSMLDGSRSVRDWVAGFGSVDEQMTFLRTLHLLVECGLVRL